MYICICHGVSDKTIAKALDKGATYAQLARELGVGTSCGQCAAEIKAMVNAHQFTVCACVSPATKTYPKLIGNTLHNS